MSAKPKQAQPRNKSVKNLLPAVSEESTVVISKAVPSATKAIYLRSLYIFIYERTLIVGT
jgi:hypothetical protein